MIEIVNALDPLEIIFYVAVGIALLIAIGTTGKWGSGS